MSWSSSTRSKRLPGNWHTTRSAVLERDGHLCQIRIPGVCTVIATEADHIRHGDDHTMTNLQAACPPCHKRKTQTEARAATPSRRRPAEQHPGLTG